MTETVIRPASVDDAPAFTEVIRAAYGPWIDRLEAMPDVDSGVVEEIVSNPVWVATLGDHVVGGLVMHISDTGAEIANLAVHPECGGQGIGRALMRVAEDHARALGFVRLALATHRDMTPTLRFYRNDGWIETDREGYRVFMEKELT